MSMFDTTAMTVSELTADNPAATAALIRAKTFDMSQAAECAVLAPKEEGAWSHELRAALAARIARMNGDLVLSAHYGAGAGDLAVLADPNAEITSSELAPVVAFMDKVALQTGQVESRDVTALQDANISDADIVRLAELNAFISYQVRVIAGLRLLNGTGQ
ncbi:MAG: hypothetical protein ACI9UK_001967 [Candidatus Krumholzibacteriia bacterium]